MEMVVDTMRRTKGARLGATGLRGGVRPILSDELKRHFRESYPVLLDGALSPNSIPDFFLRRARQSLARCGGEPQIMSSAILREALECIVAKAIPSTKAGLVAIGPKRARVWWDKKALDNLDEVIARLTKPRPVLRFYDVTGLSPESGRWNNVFDIDIDIDEKGRTVDFWTADRTYIVDLGFIHADGIFHQLARTNLTALPREGKGEQSENASVARSSLASRVQLGRIQMTPDAKARQWAAVRPDHHRRDLEAELVIHMLYRAFLDSGPRALRLAPPLLMRDKEVLRQEFIHRGRLLERRLRTQDLPKERQLLVADLGTVRPRREKAIQFLPAPLAAAPRRLDGLIRSGQSLQEFAFFRNLTATIRSGCPYRSVPGDLVQIVSPNKNVPLSFMATPVFEAAEKLRRQLSDLLAPPPVPASRRKAPAAATRDFAGEKESRPRKPGVRLAHAALTLEGRMRPGARLRVAGKMVKADSDGRFRLECTLADATGSMPISSIFRSGETRNVVKVEWSRSAQKRKVPAVR